MFSEHADRSDRPQVGRCFELFSHRVLLVLLLLLLLRLLLLHTGRLRLRLRVRLHLLRLLGRIVVARFVPEVTPARDQV